MAAPVFVLIAVVAGGYLVGRALHWLWDRLEDSLLQPAQPRRGGRENGSFGWTAATMLAVSAASAYVQHRDAVASSQQAIATAKTNATLADEATNRANQKAPDSAAAMAANILAGKQGQSGTMLTGPGGVDPSQLTLGKSSLLGGP